MGVELSDGTKTVMIATAGGQACRFNEKEIRPAGRATYGVIGIRLKNKKDYVVAMTVVEITGSLFTITENGFGKRSPIDEYRMTHRGSKGVRTIITNERNGHVVFVSQVTDENELIITTEHGMTVRIPVRDIREQGRATMGVRIMRLNEADKVVSVTKIVAENGEQAHEGASMENIPLGIVEEQPVKKEPAALKVEPKKQPPVGEEKPVAAPLMKEKKPLIKKVLKKKVTPTKKPKIKSVKPKKKKEKSVKVKKVVTPKKKKLPAKKPKKRLAKKTKKQKKATPKKQKTKPKTIKKKTTTTKKKRKK